MNNILTQEQKNEIDELCIFYKIDNYIINADSSIDVVGSVNLIKLNLEQIPIKFNRVSGNFFCHDNQLTSLEGCPHYVGGFFGCSGNKLSNLNHSPIEVGGNFHCNDNELTSLVGSPNVVKKDFECERNKLTNLVGCPQVGGDLKFNTNLLNSLKGCQDKVQGSFYCIDNKLTTLEYSPKEVGGCFHCHYNELTCLKYYPTIVGASYSFDHNNLPNEFRKLFLSISPTPDEDWLDWVDIWDTRYDTTYDVYLFISEREKTFIKYMNDYEVWLPEYSEENMELLIDDINDGLL